MCRPAFVCVCVCVCVCVNVHTRMNICACLCVFDLIQQLQFLNQPISVRHVGSLVHMLTNKDGRLISDQ